MPLQGKGFFIWKIPYCEKGDVKAIAELAVQAGLSHILIKISDGIVDYNVDRAAKVDLVPALVQELRMRNIAVWGWQYAYGYSPTGEADKVVQRVQKLNLEGLIVNAEAEFKVPGMEKAAWVYMKRIRTAMPDLPIGLSSFRYPSLHRQFPFRHFLEFCDFNMPQVYWMGANNPADQLIRCAREFQSVIPVRPIIPTGAAFRQGNWSANAQEVQQFLEAAKNLNYTGANFWEWSNTRRLLPEVWDAIGNFSWKTISSANDISQRYVSSLNKHNPEDMAALYNANAVFITPEGTIQGSTAIRNWYEKLFRQVLPSGIFAISGLSGDKIFRHFAWTATATTAKVLDGNDTFGLADDLIAFHHSSFTVSKP
jgi:hypothetical protein